MTKANSSIDRTKLREEVIADGLDDYYGLYEVVGSLNGEYPDATQEQRIAAARAVIHDLFIESKVSLYTTVWPSNHYEVLSKEGALAAIASQAVWEDPTNGPYVAYSAA